MRRSIILTFVILMLVMCSCTAQNTNNEIIKESQVKTSCAEKILDENSEEKIQEEKPHVSITPRWFESEEELVAAIKDDSKANGEYEYKVNSMSYYFVPNIVPEKAELDYIAIMDFYVALYYKFDNEPDPFWERTFMFEWYRTKKSGDTEMNVKRQYSQDEIKQKNEYYIIKIKPTKDYKGDSEYVCQNVYWEDNGYAFHAVVPIWFTEADIEKYCVAKKVVEK